MLLTKRAKVIGVVEVPVNNYVKFVLQDEENRTHEVNMALTLAQEKDIYYGDVVEMEYNNCRPSIEKRIVRVILEERVETAEPV